MVTRGAKSPFQPVRGGLQNASEKKKKGEMATYSELYRQVKNRANKFMPTENLVQ